MLANATSHPSHVSPSGTLTTYIPEQPQSNTAPPDLCIHEASVYLKQPSREACHSTYWMHKHVNRPMQIYIFAFCSGANGSSQAAAVASAIYLHCHVLYISEICYMTLVFRPRLLH